MRAVLPCVFVCAAMAALAGEIRPPIDLAAHAKGATRVVVAKVVSVESRFDINPFGDQVIVSDTVLEIEEALKGPRVPSLSVTVEGGTVGDVTLEVSDVPMLERGHRAVFFLNEAAPGLGTYLPHGRGLGILKLDTSDRIADTTLTLDDVRRALAATGR
jgi:hypothetical protein